MTDTTQVIFARVALQAPPDDVDWLIARLFELGATGVEQRDGGTLEQGTTAGRTTLLASFDSDEAAALAIDGIDASFLPRRDDVVGDAWRDGWRKHFRPFRLSNSIAIRPSWEHSDAIDAPHVLTLDPGHAFGTGLHATTALVAAALERHTESLSSKAVLDVGCGSGILALCALVLGAARARAVDNDPEAIAATRENAEANGMADRVVADTTDVRHVRGTYPVVLANIEARTLVVMAPWLSARVESGGLLVLSGVLADQADEVVRAFAPMVLEHTAHRDEWVALELRAPR
ncbi:MAG: 50S ribosomal protein L11 methyltransferase [Polyangiaceae bacterium]|jgi:ribosomal protein L11 methyltransferase|nr:50S ribosomal protein L11 methyltransferase [Polyangiaceae bacterium]